MPPFIVETFGRTAFCFPRSCSQSTVLLLLLALLHCLSLTAAQGQALEILFAENHGGYPENDLVQGSDGNFYGTTREGGASNLGTIFKVTPSGVLTTLVSFDGSNGANPFASLLKGSDGNFYGTTCNGGTSNQGTVFKMTPEGVLTTLASFDISTGRSPLAGVVEGSDATSTGQRSREVQTVTERSSR